MGALPPSPEGRLSGWVTAGFVAGAVAFDWLLARTALPFPHGPDGVLAAALALAAAGSPTAATRVALAGGVLAELPGGVLLGLGAVTRLVAVELARRGLARLQTDSYAVLAAVVLVTGVAERAMGLAGAWFFGVPVPLSVATAGRVLQVALLTTALFALVYPLAAWLCWPRPAARAPGAEP